MEFSISLHEMEGWWKRSQVVARWSQDDCNMEVEE